MKRKLKANLQFNFNNVDGDTLKQVNDFYKWLQNEQEKGQPDIPLSEQALLKVYQGEILKKDDTKLYQLWAKYSKKVNRVGAEDTDLKNKNKTELFEKVIEKLSGDQKTQAEKDLKELNINIDNQHFRK
jgi:hypothetical protein